MTVTIPDKVYFRIGEVGRILGVEPYVIRYWETEFKSLRPARTRSDQRLYKRSDIEELLKIKNLLYKEKFTIEGAKKRLAAGDVDRSGGSGGESHSHGRVLADIKKELQEIQKMLQ